MIVEEDLLFISFKVCCTIEYFNGNDEYRAKADNFNYIAYGKTKEEAKKNLADIMQSLFHEKIYKDEK